jgi:hypothetical protein
MAILNENLNLSNLLFAPSAPLRLKNPGNHLGSLYIWSNCGTYFCALVLLPEPDRPKVSPDYIPMRHLLIIQAILFQRGYAND